MRRFKALCKKEVYSLKSKRIVGSLRDILVDNKGHMRYIVVNTGNIFNDNWIYGIHNVKSFTKNAIEIKDEARRELRADGDAQSIINILGRMVKSEDKIVGMVEDVHLDLRHRSIIGFEISRGFLMDVCNGMQIILFEDILFKDGYIVCHSRNGLEVYKGGIKNIINREG